MTLQATSGLQLIGPPSILAPGSGLSSQSVATANGAVYFIGRIRTADGGSHTIDTTGASSIGWECVGATFANGATSISVGIGSVDTTTGPPGRPVISSGVVAMDVAAVFTGGGGGITTGWLSSVPTTGTKTIADGDLVAVSVQMTARGGSDTVTVGYPGVYASCHRPIVATFNGTSSYTMRSGFPNCVVKFSDGSLGWFEGSEMASNWTTRSFNSGSTPKEFGQLIQLPYPVKIEGIYGITTFNNDCDVVLYSDPLGTPVAEKTISFTAKTTNGTSASWFFENFILPYSAAANQPLGVVLKPGASSVSAYYKTIGNSAYRVADWIGPNGYGISRSSGAFTNANSSLDHYYLGLIVNAFEGGGGGYGVIGS